MTDDRPGGATLWHGRFERGPADELMAYTASLRFDRRLWPQDVRGSQAHVRGLQRAGLLTEADAGSLIMAARAHWFGDEGAAAGDDVVAAAAAPPADDAVPAERAQ